MLPDFPGEVDADCWATAVSVWSKGEGRAPTLRALHNYIRILVTFFLLYTYIRDISIILRSTIQNRFLETKNEQARKFTLR